MRIFCPTAVGWNSPHILYLSQLSKVSTLATAEQKPTHASRNDLQPKEYSVTAKRLDDTGSGATANAARIILDTGMAGRPDAFNPAELLLASLAACMIKGAERVAPMINV